MFAGAEGNLGEEFRSGGRSLDEVCIPFLHLGCICATGALVAGFGAEGFVDLLASTDGPTPEDDATAVAAFDSCGLDGTAIVGG